MKWCKGICAEVDMEIGTKMKESERKWWRMRVGIVESGVEWDGD